LKRFDYADDFTIKYWVLEI